MKSFGVDRTDFHSLILIPVPDWRSQALIPCCDSFFFPHFPSSGFLYHSVLWSAFKNLRHMWVKWSRFHFVDGSFSSIYTRLRSWSHASQWLLLLLMTSVSQLPQTAEFVGRLHHYFMDGLSSYCCQSKCQIRAEFPPWPKSSVIRQSPCISIRCHQPSKQQTPVRDIRHLISPVSVIQKKRSEKKKLEGDLVTGSLHHGSSEAWSYRYIYRPADRIQIIRRPSG